LTQSWRWSTTVADASQTRQNNAAVNAALYAVPRRSEALVGAAVLPSKSEAGRAERSRAGQFADAPLWGPTARATRGSGLSLRCLGRRGIGHPRIRRCGWGRPRATTSVASQPATRKVRLPMASRVGSRKTTTGSCGTVFTTRIGHHPHGQALNQRRHVDSAPASSSRDRQRASGYLQAQGRGIN
jgi:hypothetical protein